LKSLIIYWISEAKNEHTSSTIQNIQGPAIVRIECTFPGATHACDDGFANTGIRIGSAIYFQYSVVVNRAIGNCLYETTIGFLIIPVRPLDSDDAKIVIKHSVDSYSLA